MSVHSVIFMTGINKNDAAESCIITLVLVTTVTIESSGAVTAASLLLFVRHGLEPRGTRHHFNLPQTPGTRAWRTTARAHRPTRRHSLLG